MESTYKGDVVVSVPRSIADWEASRVSRAKITLIDRVEELHLELGPNEHYGMLHDAVVNAAASEGSLRANAYKAAMMIRDLAKEKNEGHVEHANLEAIKQALNYVLRRFEQSVKQRRAKAEAAHKQAAE